MVLYKFVLLSISSSTNTKTTLSAINLLFSSKYSANLSLIFSSSAFFRLPSFFSIPEFLATINFFSYPKAGVYSSETNLFKLVSSIKI